MSKKNEDLALVEAASVGDHEAFAELVKRYERRIFSLALQMTKNASEAEEIVQEAFVRAWKNLPRFQGGSSFYTWIYRITHNLAIDHFRRRKRRPTSEFEERIHSDTVDDGQMAPSLALTNPFKAAANAELKRTIERALGELSEPHRRIVFLREYEELAYEEIATLLEIPKGTVMSRLFHARRKLKEALIRHGEGQG